MMRYRYVHTATEATTGYFSCEPSPFPSLAEALTYLASHPLDDFIRRHLLTRLGALPRGQIAQAIATAFGAAPLPAPVSVLIQELCLLNPVLENDALISGTPKKDEDAATSLIFLRWKKLPDRELQRQWDRVLTANIREHRALKRPEEFGLPPLYPGIDAEKPGEARGTALPFTTGIAEVHARFLALQEPDALPHQRPPSEETASLAEERLNRLGIVAGREMRHTASLSPVALLRPWNMRLSVRRGRHDFSLEGQATTYGRGLSVPDARASCLMEMVERASAYLSLTEEGIMGLAAPLPVLSATRSALLAEHGAAINPNDFSLEVPYHDEPLTWVRGEQKLLPGSNGSDAETSPVWVPVQMVSLFCNLDEISLCDAPGSTGIATGRSMEEAKVAALLEILERDAEATTPFSKAACFTLDADDAVDPFIATLLAGYRARGIHVQFQDLTGPLGVPVYKCFVMSSKGAIAAGHGAGLSGRRAVLSALTETPFPYPDGGPSGPLLRKLPARRLHELPDYPLATPAANLALLEELLLRNGRAPVYVDITRKDLGFPVVRALVPGMEPAADGSDFRRVPYRLYANYLRLFSSSA